MCIWRRAVFRNRTSNQDSWKAKSSLVSDGGPKLTMTVTRACAGADQRRVAAPLDEARQFSAAARLGPVGAGPRHFCQVRNGGLLSRSFSASN